MERGGEALPDQKLLPSQRLSFWGPQGLAARNLTLRPLNEGPCSHQASRGEGTAIPDSASGGMDPCHSQAQILAGPPILSCAFVRQVRVGRSSVLSFPAGREDALTQVCKHTCNTPIILSPIGAQDEERGQRPRWVFCRRKLGNNPSVHLQRRPN